MNHQQKKTGRMLKDRTSQNVSTSSPRKLQHTLRAHHNQSPQRTMKGIPLQPVGKGLGVCSKGVLQQP